MTQKLKNKKNFLIINWKFNFKTYKLILNECKNFNKTNIVKKQITNQKTTQKY